MRLPIPFLLVCLAAAAAPPAPRKHALRVPVWLDGDTPLPLGAKDFSARLDGAPAPVLSVRGPRDDLMLLLVLDLTGDIALVDIARDALVANLRGLPPKAAAALFKAPDGLQVLIDPGPDRARLAAAIRALPVSGKPALLDTLEPAARVAGAVLDKAAVRLALLYVTDSDIRNYRDDYTNPVINSSDQRDLSRYFPEGLVREKISALESKLAGLEAPIFLVHLSYRSDRLNEAYQAGLKQLAAATGGRSVFCRSQAEIPEAVAATFRAAASHYSLSIRLPDNPPKVLQLELESPHHALTYRERFTLY